jgi:hypothetical protein
VSRLQTSFVLGYHGCDKAIGFDVVTHKIPMKPSTTGFDWIGTGVYFWEGDPQRAKEWAIEKTARGDYKEPYVIGGAIDLGNCLDLLVRENLELLRFAHDAFKADREKAGLEMPVNKKAKKDGSDDLVMRYLDCAVVDYLHAIIAGPNRPDGLEPFDTVRALFSEGDELYPGGGFRHKTHSQIAVRNLACIKGLFLPLPPV